MSIKFRLLRGTLADSMETVITIKSRGDLLRYLEKILPFEIELELDQISVRPYGGDDRRNGWQNHLVRIEGIGPVGFTNKMI